MFKILYCEDEYKSVITKNVEEAQRLITQTDIRQRLNPNRQMNVYKVNFDSNNLTDDDIINLFEISNSKRRDKLFLKLY